MTGAYVVTGSNRIAVPSIRGYLRESLLDRESFMDATVMKPEEVAICKWVGFGIGKGVTSTSQDLTIFGIPGRLGSGWHAELVKGLPGVDPSPLCYMPEHKLGFGDFVRWVYFADPHNQGDYFGVDFGLTERSTAGVGESVIRVASVARHALAHGVPGNTHLVLLGPRMIEEEVVTSFRQRLSLHTVNDWADRGASYFSNESGPYCWKCGLDTRKPQFRFCYRCGAEFLASS
jgi:hypothetical protein